MDVWQKHQGYAQLIEHGHTRRQIDNPYTARRGSHDDGKDTGLFLGGIGTAVCSRDLTGKFGRWHLQPGYHVRQIIDSAYLGLFWTDGTRQNYSRLDESWSGEREVHTLFPVTCERYHTPEKNLELIVEFFTPLVQGDSKAQSLPLWYVRAAVRSLSSTPIEVHLVFSFPNLLGWKAQQTSSALRGTALWPSQTHAGNSAAALEGTIDENLSYHGVLQLRHPCRPVTDEMEGEAAILSFGPNRQNTSREICMFDGNLSVNKSPKKQRHTTSWAEDHVRLHGSLPGTEISWQAHWDEALASAVERSVRLEPGAADEISFAAVFDMPLVRFGDKRVWKRAYTDYFGDSGRNSEAIARYAVAQLDSHREQIHQWQQQLLSTGRKQQGAMINELYLLNGGGSVWTSGERTQHGAGIEPPLLGDREHAAILEGFDIGYYYYNTSDLWFYAWYGVYSFNPHLADLIFTDLLQSIPLEIDEKRIIYRTEKEGSILTEGKVPHDLGSPMEDPWNRLNGYQMRDDSNLWKDHNPGFILTYYLYSKMTHQPITSAVWKIMKQAAEEMLTWDPLPFHDEFGDTTWDNLGIEGYAAFSGGLFIGALAAAASWADETGELELAQRCRVLAHRAEEAYVSKLYTGSFFKVSDRGRYARCTMADSILGLYYAHAAGLGDTFTLITDQMITSHLICVYRQNMLQFKDGKLGPLLIAQEGRTQFPGDGGDELQVNEVIIGSAWLFAAMLDYFGLDAQASHVSDSIEKTIYEDSGLQFRTPAAVDGNRHFRAPLNMRPLSVWLLDMNRTLHENKEGN